MRRDVTSSLASFRRHLHEREDASSSRAAKSPAGEHGVSVAARYTDVVRALWWGVVVVMASLLACGRTEVVRWTPTVTRPDGGVVSDAGVDAGVRDAGVDAGVDAGQPDAGPKPCLDGRFRLSPAEPVVMLVIDRSGSMIDLFPGGTTSKWNALRTALNQTLPAVDDTVQLGAVFFPIDGADDCDVPAITALAPGRGQADVILTTVSLTEPRGATPTSAALRVAFDLLKDRRTANAARAMVLATDGQPTCTDPDVPLADLRSAVDAGVPTYVIGIESAFAPGFALVLERMAVAGGRARADAGTGYYSATTPEGLVEAFRDIRDQVAACSFLTESVPDADGGMSLLYGSEVVPYDPTGASGWSWTDRRNGELVLRGDICARVIAVPQMMQVVVSCGQ